MSAFKNKGGITVNQLLAGFARVNIDPPLGIAIAGYYVPRFASGFLDSLEASALALSCGEEPIVLLSVDSCGIRRALADDYRARIAQAVGIPAQNIFLSATHTHTGPLNTTADHFEMDVELIARYVEFLGARLADAARMAVSDLKPARMGFIVGWAPERVAYIRRYRMKDGSVCTCPPVGDPNIDHPLGTLDQRVNVLRFDRPKGDTIVLMNYGLHADTINGDRISPDWPGWMRRTVEKTLDGTKCIFFNGAEGDVGSTHVFPCGGDMNDTEISFDNEMKSPGMARFVGRALAGTILQVFDKAEYVDVDSVAILHQTVTVAANVPSPEELPLAHKYHELHHAGRDDEIPYRSMELTTVLAKAERICRMEHGPASFELELTGVRIGNIAMIGIPGEPFTEIGVQIKDTDGWDMILPCCLTNGSEGYFPMRSAFDEGGYEALSSKYKAGVAEDIITGAKAMLAQLRG